MALIQLASGDWYEESNLPVRNGQRYDPTHAYERDPETGVSVSTAAQNAGNAQLTQNYVDAGMNPADAAARVPLSGTQRANAAGMASRARPMPRYNPNDPRYRNTDPREVETSPYPVYSNPGGYPGDARPTYKSPDGLTLSNIGSEDLGGPDPSALPEGYATGGTRGTRGLNTHQGQNTFQGMTGSPLTILSPDGQEYDFTAITEDMERLMMTPGAQVIDPTTGEPMEVTPGVYGGILLNGLPINVVMGMDWLPGQREALTNYYAAGWRPGQNMPALSDPPALTPDTAGRYGYTPESAGSPLDFGYLAQTFEEPFNYDRPEEQFKFDRQAPQRKQLNPADIVNDPGYQFELEQGMKALERSRSAAGILKSGGTVPAALRYSQGLAATKFNDAFERNMAEYGADVGAYESDLQRGLTEFGIKRDARESDWQKQMSEYAQRRDIHRTNRTDLFNRYATLADMGSVASGQTTNFGTELGRQGNEAITSAGNATAAGRVGAGNAWRDAASGIADAAYPYYRRRTSLSQLGAA